MSVQRCFNDFIGSLISPQLRMPVDDNGQQAAQRQQENQPHMLTANMRDKVESMVEHRTQQTTDCTHDQAEYAPPNDNFNKYFCMPETFCPIHSIAFFLI